MMERQQVVPNVYQGHYQQGKQDVVRRFNDFYNVNLSPWQQYFWQASIDRKVYAGDQHYLNRYSSGTYEILKFVFNKTMKLWNAVGGYQRKNRKSSRMVPLHNASNLTSSQKTKLITYAYERDDTYNKISECFDETGITGLSLLHMYMDYRFDPICGNLASEVCTSDMMMMDAFWKNMDLSDCQAIATRKFLKKETASLMLPGMEAEVMAVNAEPYYDNKFTFMPQQYNIRRKGVVAWDEFYYADTRMATFVIDPETYESYQYDGPIEKIDELRDQFPNVIITKQQIPTVNLAIMINGTCFYDGPNPLGIDKYPFAVLPGYHDTAIQNYMYRYQGLIRNARDGQYLYNYRMQLELDLLASQFSGVDVEVDSLVDNRDAFKSGPGKVRFFKKGRLNSIRDVPGANLSGSNPEITERIGMNILSNTGVNEELLGAADDSEVGITTMLKQGAALTTLHKLFDNLDLFQRNVTRLADDIIQKNYTYGKIKQILGEEPSPEFKDRIFQKYDCVVENAPMTHSSKQLAFMQYYQLWKDGFPVPMEVLIDLLQVQDKDKWIAVLQQQQQQQQQMQAQMAQAQLENQQIVNQNLLAKAESDKAMAAEKMSKVNLEKFQSYRQLTEAQAALDRANLDNVKAAKELEGLDLTHMQQLVDLVKSMTEEKKEEATEKASV